MFARVAGRYDLLNRLMTGGQDIRWRKLAIQLAGLASGARLLDVGTGTGDLAREALRQQPKTQVVAADFTLEMIRAGQPRRRLDWCAADALRLPFPDQCFDAVVSGFLMRNVIDVEQSLREQLRVLKPGGRVVVLDTTRPRRSLLSPLIWIHMHAVIPTLGGMVSGSGEAYRYLPDSTEGFVSAEELAGCMAAAGFRAVRFRILGFGTIALHWAQR